MTMETYVDLYLARNIESLDLLALKNCSVFELKKKKLSFDKWCDLLKKLYRESQQNVLDQEQTYVLLARYLHLYNHFLNAEPDKKFVKTRFGAEYSRVQSQYLLTKHSLEMRYALLNESSGSPKAPLSRTSSSPTPPLDVTTYQPLFTSEFITCQQLFSALRKNVLIVDARPECDYKESRIDVVNIINAPEHCIRTGLSAHMLGTHFPPEVQQVWNRRDSYDVMILIDWNCTPETLPTSKLVILRTSVLQWDLNRKYKEKPVILQGGYIEWLQTYPTQCINPHVILSKKNNELDELLDIDNIVYPSESDKIHVIEVPEINRNASTDNQVASRNNLMHEYTEVTTDRKEIIEQLIEAENEWKTANDLLAIEHNKDTLTNSLQHGVLSKQLKQADDTISFLQQELFLLDKKKEAVEEKVELYAEFDPKKSAAPEDMKRMVEIDDEDTLKDKILSAVAEDRREALKKARSMKPKPNMDGTIPRPMDPTPIINRSNKPRMYVKPSAALLTPLQMTPGLVGLKNIRNTCYLNTAIQCFRNVPVVMSLFCGGQYSKFNIRKPAALILETAALIRSLWSKPVKYIEPMEFYSKVCTLQQEYAAGNHEDSMEFFLCLLNHLSDDCTFESKKVDVLTPKMKAWHNQFQGKNSIFINLFYHQIRIIQDCTACSKKSYKFEIENTFLLPVPETDFQLTDLLADYLGSFMIKEYCCSHCGKPVINRKEICTYPKVVVCILKRYHPYTENGGVKFRKTNTRCFFPDKCLQLGSCKYQLSSIAMHMGDLNCGHYTAAALTQNGWYEFNDEVVKPININDDVVRVKACAFFYSLRDELN